MQNLLLATAIADAFGAGVEFQDRDWIRQNVDFTKFVNARHTINVPEEKKSLFTKNYQAWDYTDDTEMTIGTIKALMSDESFTEELLVKKWRAEYQKGISEKGVGRNGHGSMSWYYSGEMTIDQVRDFQRDRPNPGNAPAMRAVPLGLISEELINEYAAINARATHPNINAIISSQCIARAAEFILVRKGKPSEVIAYCQEKITLNPEYKKYLDQVAQLPVYEKLNDTHFEILCGPQPIKAPYFLPGIKGVPSDSKYTTGCVLYILRNSYNAMDALRKSVHLGGDVDSVASITTAIMAEKTGLKSIPNFMLENIEGKQYLEDIGEAFTRWIKSK